MPSALLRKTPFHLLSHTDLKGTQVLFEFMSSSKYCMRDYDDGRDYTCSQYPLTVMWLFDSIAGHCSCNHAFTYIECTAPAGIKCKDFIWITAMWGDWCSPMDCKTIFIRAFPSRHYYSRGCPMQWMWAKRFCMSILAKRNPFPRKSRTTLSIFRHNNQPSIQAALICSTMH